MQFLTGCWTGWFIFLNISAPQRSSSFIMWLTCCQLTLLAGRRTSRYPFSVTYFSSLCCLYPNFSEKCCFKHTQNNLMFFTKWNNVSLSTFIQLIHLLFWAFYSIPTFGIGVSLIFLWNSSLMLKSLWRNECESETCSFFIRSMNILVVWKKTKSSAALCVPKLTAWCRLHMEQITHYELLLEMAVRMNFNTHMLRAAPLPTDLPGGMTMPVLNNLKECDDEC